MIGRRIEPTSLAGSHGLGRDLSLGSGCVEERAEVVQNGLGILLG